MSGSPQCLFLCLYLLDRAGRFPALSNTTCHDSSSITLLFVDRLGKHLRDEGTLGNGMIGFACPDKEQIYDRGSKLVKVL